MNTLSISELSTRLEEATEQYFDLLNSTPEETTFHDRYHLSRARENVYYYINRLSEAQQPKKKTLIQKLFKK